MKKLLILLPFIVFITSVTTYAKSYGNPRELGAVKWRRGFDKALEEAKKSRKPLLVLFQEVPG